MARNALAEALASSAVSSVVTMKGVPSASGRAYTCWRICSARREVTPATILPGARVSATAVPSRRNSGFHASSAPSQAPASSVATRRAVPTGTVDLPTTRHGRSSSGASAATQAFTWDRSA